MKIKLTTIYVSGQDKALAFYTDVLGMANNVAEGPALRLQHLQAPGRPCCHLPDVLRREFRRRGQAVAQVLVALAEDLQVGGQNQRRAFCRLGAMPVAGFGV